MGEMGGEMDDLHVLMDGWMDGWMDGAYFKTSRIKCHPNLNREIHLLRLTGDLTCPLEVLWYHCRFEDVEQHLD